MTRFTAALAGFATAMGLLIWIAAGAFVSASEHAVTYRYIADALQSTATPIDAVVWNAPGETLDRPVTPADEALIGRALSDAWQALAVAQSTGRQDLLADGFTGPALARAEKSVVDAQAGGGRMAVLSLTATPVFFHRDGSVFQAEIDMLTSRFVAGEDMPRAAIQSRDKGVVTLMNESSGWRVFSFELDGIEPLEPAMAKPEFSDLRGMNYYPAETPWRAFWPAYDPEVIGHDFNRIAALGANAVRVFLPRADFLDPTTEESRLADLTNMLAQAEAAGLTVIPTLFDLKSDYAPGTWAADATYLRRIMPVLSASGNVAFVDLKNEPDLDFEHHGLSTVIAWLEAMTAVMRREAPELALTIGWAEAGAATWLSDQVDVVTYHDYAPIADAAARLEAVRSAARGKPVVVTEIGTSSYELTLGFPGSPNAQAASLSERLEALADADGVMVWTLHDFPEIDATAVGASPWVGRLQSAFGLIAADGSEKPAANAVRTAFAKRSAP